MSFDSSHLMATVSLVGSAVSAGATLYFWLSKVRREQPNLKIYSADRSTEVILGVYRGETRSLQFRTSVVVANYSLLPNAVIAAELAVRRRDRSFEDIGSPRVAGLPLNVPSMTTVRIEFEWSAMLPALASAEELKASQIPQAYLDHYYSDPIQIGVSLWALGETEFRAVLPLRRDRADAGGLRLAQAA